MMESLTSLARVIGCLGLMLFAFLAIEVAWIFWIPAVFCLVACFLSNPTQPPPPPQIIYMQAPPPDETEGE